MTALRYKPSPTIDRFMDSDAFVRAVVGPVGSGKSSGCIMEIFRRAMEQKPGPDGLRKTRFCIIRNTYPELRDTTRKTFEQWLGNSPGVWKEQEFTFTLSFSDVRCEVLFRALDKPQDIKKLLSLELTGAYINEAREIPKSVFDVLQARVGRYPAKVDGGPTWYGVWLDTNPWATTSWGYKLFSDNCPASFELFEQPGGLADNAENVENLPPGYYQRLTDGKDQEWVDEYIHAKYPANERGSVYGQLISEMGKKGQLQAFEHGTDGVFVAVDLGISDSFAMWFFRFGPNRGVDVIDHYEAHGRPLSHYFDVLEKKGYEYTKIFLPHDARQRSLQTGVSTQDLFQEKFPNLAIIGPDVSVADGLQAGRWLMEQPTTRIHPRCSEITGPEDIDGVEALRCYRYEYDDEKKVYKKTPLHDWASHTSDTWRYVATAVRFSELMTRPPPPSKPVEQHVQNYSLPALSNIRTPGRGRM